MSNQVSEFRAYPFLDGEEFTEVCHQLDRRYCQATLGPARRRWRLRVCSSLNTSFSLGAEYSTYIQIVRPLDGELDDGDLAAALDQFSLQAPDLEALDADVDTTMIENENSDHAAVLAREAPNPSFGFVTYEIHLHPTYRSPCLWFNLQGLPADEPCFSVDTVFRRLVPDEYKEGLRSTIGGISADHHPVTGVPSFFVHPCLLGEAMKGFDCSKENYLMVWLGLVGGCVGLWIPKEMALEQGDAATTTGRGQP